MEILQSISVISRDQIDLLDWSNLGQTVLYVAGVNGENYDPDERVDWLTMRGFEPVRQTPSAPGVKLWFKSFRRLLRRMTPLDNILAALPYVPHIMLQSRRKALNL